MSQVTQGSTVQLRVTVRDATTGSLIDLSGATSKDIVLRREGARRSVHAASFTTDGSDGQLEITLDPDDLTVGKYRYMVEVVLGGQTLRSGIDTFRVTESL